VAADFSACEAELSALRHSAPVNEDSPPEATFRKGSKAEIQTETLSQSTG
jgi:hypothetical protein